MCKWCRETIKEIAHLFGHKVKESDLINLIENSPLVEEVDKHGFEEYKESN